MFLDKVLEDMDIEVEDNQEEEEKEVSHSANYNRIIALATMIFTSDCFTAEEKEELHMKIKCIYDEI